MANYQILSQSPVFMGIQSEMLEELFRDIHFQIRKYRKNELLVSAGEVCDRLIILQRGSVKAEMNDYSGKTIKIEDMEAPFPLATAFLFGRDNRFPVTVISNTEVETISIPQGEFTRLLQKNAQILNNYLNAISTRTQFLSQKLKFLSFKTIRQKIAHYLLEQAGDRLSIVPIAHSQNQLAEIFGVTRPSLARTLGEMSREGYIEVLRGAIKIMDKEKMNRLLEG
jgi:CRP/FNR family transcriptional regulator, dissimilatory nitrate respiration regulator